MGLRAGALTAWRPRITWKRLVLAVLAVVVVLAVVDFGVGWYYAGEIEKGGFQVDHDPHDLKGEVVEVRPDQIVLTSEGDGEWNDPALWGLEAEAGYGRLGEILSQSESTVTRQFELLDGTIATGDMARTDSYAHPNDPRRAHGIPFEEVIVRAPIGDLPAWYVDGSDDTWVIYVHGRSGNRGEGLRTLPVSVEAGLPGLMISYRNDEELPADPTGYYQFGKTEWEDLEAAAEYAMENGARDLILVGYSMGGGICASFLYQSPFADRVIAVILDSPMLDFGQTVDFGTSQRNLPGILGATAKWLATLRYGADWKALDFLSRADELSMPMLLFHGDADTMVPVGTSEALAARRPDLVTFVKVEDAKHVGSWNKAPDRYEREVRDFLTRVAR